MRLIERSERYRQTLIAFVSICLLVLLSACQGNTQGQTTPGAPTAPGQTGQGNSVTVQVAGHQNTPGAQKTPSPRNKFNAGSAPGPVTTGGGSLPTGMPRYFSFGVMNDPNDVAELDAMRSQNKTAFSFRYQYLSGGVNTGHGWETYNQPTGQYALYYMQTSAQHGYIPGLVYYDLCQSNGPQGSGCSGRDNLQDPANLASPAVMNAYYANWTLLMREIGTFGKPALVIVEPDLWGFLEQTVLAGTNSAASVPASVSSSGYADAAGFPNTAQGFAWALLHMRDKYAHNAILALHASSWAAGPDVASDSSSGLDVNAVARREANFLNSAGLSGNPAGVSRWDLLSNDVADHDSGQPGGHAWWDRYNRIFPNFARYLNYIGALTQDTQRRVVMWQVPVGNQYFDSMNNAPGHYQDNRAEYILGYTSSFARAGIVAVLFGPGNGGTMNGDRMHDGVTNPAPINTYECNLCNNHRSSYPDDDGGFLRIFTGQYMQHPIALT